MKFLHFADLHLGVETYGNMAQPAFDYIALGHIHRHQVLCENPPEGSPRICRKTNARKPLNYSRQLIELTQGGGRGQSNSNLYRRWR